MNLLCWSWLYGAKENYRNRGQWVMIAWLDAMGYIMLWVMTRLLHGCIAGVHATKHSSQAISIHVYTCTAILLFCAMILQAYIMLMCIRDVCSNEWFMLFCYWYSSDAYVVIVHPIHFPLLRFIHVFIRVCLCSAGSIRNIGDEGMCRTVFLSLNKIRVFCTCIYRHCD